MYEENDPGVPSDCRVSNEYIFPIICIIIIYNMFYKFGKMKKNTSIFEMGRTNRILRLAILCSHEITLVVLAGHIA